MPPGKEDKQDLAKYIWGRDIEVVLQGWYGDIAVQL